MSLHRTRSLSVDLLGPSLTLNDQLTPFGDRLNTARLTFFIRCSFFADILAAICSCRIFSASLSRRSFSLSLFLPRSAIVPVPAERDTAYICRSASLSSFISFSTALTACFFCSSSIRLANGVLIDSLMYDLRRGALADL